MRLEGSCHCGAVRFSLISNTPHPFNLCYCSICRKTAGGGGYAINIMGQADTLEIEGEQNITRFHATVDGKPSEAERAFCSKCGSALWLYDERWPKNVYPLASAIDTDLPAPPERTHLMLASKASWVEVMARDIDKQYPRYPEEGIEDWHRRRGLWVED